MLKRFVWLAGYSLLLGVGTGVPGWAQQSNPNGIIPLHTTNQPYLFLVRDPVVQRDLGLSPNQAKQLQKLNDRLDLPLWSMRNKGGDHIAKTMQKAIEKTRSTLAEVLTAEQNERIQQIEYWVLGLKALMRDDVAASLELTSEQRSTTREIIVTAQKELTRLQQELQQGGDADGLNKQYREVQTSQQEDILAVMTPTQQQTFKALLGRRIDASKLGRIKFKVPELASGGGWVNTPPLTMEKLKGKVVALHFYAFA